MKELKLKQGDEVIYFDGKTILDQTKVISINKEDESAKLANQVVVKLKANSKDGTFHRKGNKTIGYAMPLETGQSFYEAYKSKKNIAFRLQAFLDILSKLNVMEDTELINKLNSKVNKLCALVGK